MTETSEERARRLVQELKQQADALQGEFAYNDPASKVAAGRRLLAADPALKALALRAALDDYCAIDWPKVELSQGYPWALGALVREIVRRHPGLAEADLRAVTRAWLSFSQATMPFAGLVGCIERSWRDGFSAETRQAVVDLREKLRKDARTQASRKLSARLDAVMGEAARAGLDAQEAWAGTIARAVASMPGSAGSCWQELFALGVAEDAPRPSAAWLAKARAAVDRIGADEFRRRTQAWFSRVEAPQGEPYERLTSMKDANASCLRGLVWASALQADAEQARTLGALALVCFHKLFEVGPYSAKLGNACVFALGAMASSEAVAQLGRLRLKVKYSGARALIEKAYADAASRKGVSVDAIQETSVPTYGLDAEGVRRQALGGYTAEIRVGRGSRPGLCWFAADGKALKGTPAPVRRDHADELAELKKVVADIEAQLPAQRARLEGLLATERVLRFGDWRAHYVEHPLVGSLARRLIWEIGRGKQRTLASFRGQRLEGAEGRPLGKQRDSMEVRLWHPLRSRPGVVRAWRRWLVENSVTQPFKQAHREIYVLTDAERKTRSYSNRFAGHLLREHVLAALCRERGWRYKLQIGDAGGSPTLPLPGGEHSVEFQVSGTGRIYSDVHETLSTGQVRFLDANGKPFALADQPGLLFSETMRDVDLFVSVSSIAMDPAWNERGAEAERDYWQSEAFGSLSVSAEQRKELLEGLISRLSIADRCRVLGRFLLVQGRLRSYKIHLGSGNVLMEPNDQYLCIVPATGVEDQSLVLPFDGDATLAVILSKAFLLARDESIEDAQILRQIKG